MKNFFEFAQGEKRALLEFKLAKGDISPSDLCQKLSVSKQRITSILNSLYEKKYITINIDENDRRKTNIKLTPNGKKYIDKLIAYVLTDLNKIINKISSKDIDKLTEIMANINKILNE
jgi:DNA-binding MarR family transcriptional regulator